MHCSTCEEEAESFKCDKNDIFANINVENLDTHIQSVRYYKNSIVFSGCPFAFYLKYSFLINFIENQELFGFKEVDNFVKEFVVKSFIQDRNIQRNAEYLESIQEKK